MVNYSNSKIYKIVNSNCEEGNCYYGSTTNSLHKRFHQHKNNYTKWKAGKYCYTTSFKLFEEDFENIKIILVEEVKCENKQQLLARERFWIENNKCVNKLIPTRTKKERYLKNKEQILKKAKTYRINNKEKINTYMKQYRKTHKNERKEYDKHRYDLKKKIILQKRKEKIKCSFCGSCVRKSDIRRHQKTIKCKSFQNNI